MQRGFKRFEIILNVRKSNACGWIKYPCYVTSSSSRIVPTLSTSVGMSMSMSTSSSSYPKSLPTTLPTTRRNNTPGIQTNNDETITQEEEEEDKSSNRYRLLYRRERATFPRVLLASTTAHLAYWLWYVVDFTPTVNSSPMTYLHVDPTLGYVGFSLSVIMLGGATIYPRFLISEISSSTTETDQDKKGVPGNTTVYVKCFNLPFVTPQSLGTELQPGVRARLEGEKDRSTVVDEGVVPDRRHMYVTVEGMKRGGGFLLEADREGGEIVDEAGLVDFLMGKEIPTVPIRRGKVKNDKSSNGKQTNARMVQRTKRIQRRRA